METISAIKKPYIQDDSSQGTGREEFFWQLYLSNGTKCNQTATTIRAATQEMNTETETITEGGGQGSRWGERSRELLGTCQKTRIYTEEEYLSAPKMDLDLGRKTAVLWLRACSQICCHEKDTCTVTKKKERMREKTLRIQSLIALPCSRWNWNHSPSGWI